MRILFWADYCWPSIGGVQEFSLQLIRALTPRGCRFTIVAQAVSGNYEQHPFDDDVSVHAFPFQQVLMHKDLKGILTIRRQLAELKRTWKPDLVHLNISSASALLHLQTETAWPAPVLFTLHTSLKLSANEDSLFGKLLRRAHWVNAVSVVTLGDACSLVPEIQKRASVIHNALPMPQLQHAPLSFAPPRIVCLGRHARQKGFDLALKSFAALRSDHPQARLIIAGDGEERGKLEHLASALSLGDAVEFPGWVSPEKIPEFLNTATLVLMPSRWEPFGLVALQAAQMVRPVVATAVDGLCEVVAHRHTGLLVANEDVLGLTTALHHLLNNPELAVQMGQAARQRAAERFSHQRFVNEYEALYRQVQNGRTERKTELPQHRLEHAHDQHTTHQRHDSRLQRRTSYCGGA